MRIRHHRHVSPIVGHWLAFLWKEGCETELLKDKIHRLDYIRQIYLDLERYPDIIFDVNNLWSVNRIFPNHSPPSILSQVRYSSRYLQSEAYKKMNSASRPVVTEFGTRCYPDPCKNIFSRWDLSAGRSLSLWKLSSDPHVFIYLILYYLFPYRFVVQQRELNGVAEGLPAPNSTQLRVYYRTYLKQSVLLLQFVCFVHATASSGNNWTYVYVRWAWISSRVSARLGFTVGSRKRDEAKYGGTNHAGFSLPWSPATWRITTSATCTL